MDLPNEYFRAYVYTEWRRENAKKSFSNFGQEAELTNHHLKQLYNQRSEAICIAMEPQICLLDHDKSERS